MRTRVLSHTYIHTYKCIQYASISSHATVDNTKKKTLTHTCTQMLAPQHAGSALTDDCLFVKASALQSASLQASHQPTNRLKNKTQKGLKITRNTSDLQKSYTHTQSSAMHMYVCVCACALSSTSSDRIRLRSFAFQCMDVSRSAYSVWLT